MNQKQVTNQTLRMIRNLPNKKIVTVRPKGKQPQKFDVSEDGDVGYEQEHTALFTTKLSNAINNGGVLIIRQFTDRSVEVELKNDKKKLPIKNLYGFQLGGGCVVPVSSDKLKEAMTTHHETGKDLDEEPAVRYCELDFEKRVSQ